ncbi:MAG TPA: hypothetical protein VF116_18675 [Ktedonobacterales bacterium]
MNLMELLQLVDDRLRPLAVADERALQAVLDGEVAAGPRPQGVAPDVEPRAVLAGRLFGIEQECRMLREHLHVKLDVVAKVKVSIALEQPEDTR